MKLSTFPEILKPADITPLSKKAVVSVWVSEGFQHPAMPSGNVRKMEKVCR